MATFAAPEDTCDEGERLARTARTSDGVAKLVNSGVWSNYASAAMLRVRLLGGLQVDAGAARADVPAGRPARLLLGWLAAFAGEHARAEVAARLWPDVLDSSARASLRTALSELRTALGPAAVHVAATRETVALGGPDLWVDQRAFSS